MKHTNNAMERPFFCYIVVDPPITREPAGQNALPQGIVFFCWSLQVWVYVPYSFGTTGNSKKNVSLLNFHLFASFWFVGNWKFDIPNSSELSRPATAVGPPDFKAAFEVGFSILLGARAGWLSSRDEWQMWGKSFWTVGIVGITWQF